MVVRTTGVSTGNDGNAVLIYEHAPIVRMIVRIPLCQSVNICYYMEHKRHPYTDSVREAFK